MIFSTLLTCLNNKNNVSHISVSGKASYPCNFNYPKPSYVNPIPWQHPVIPKEKQEKPKRPKTKKYVWNPNKYF